MKRKVHTKIGKTHRILVEGVVFTMQRRWLGIFWRDSYRYIQDKNRQMLIPDGP